MGYRARVDERREAYICLASFQGNLGIGEGRRGRMPVVFLLPSPSKGSCEGHHPHSQNEAGLTVTCDIIYMGHCPVSNPPIKARENHDLDTFKYTSSNKSCPLSYPILPLQFTDASVVQTPMPPSLTILEQPHQDLARSGFAS